MTPPSGTVGVPGFSEAHKTIAEGKRVTAKDLKLTNMASALPQDAEGVAGRAGDGPEALRRHRGKITSAAVELGVSRSDTI